MLTLLLGGARSGKSALAVRMGGRHAGPVTYIATAAALDDDMAQRIARHRSERPASWQTIEEPLDLTAAIEAAQRQPGTLTIVDCLTLWTTNLVLDGRTDDQIVDLADDAARLAAGNGEAIVISNEVGLGVHPEHELGRRYRDVHGWVNQRFAAAASRSFLLVAGRLLALEDPSVLLRSEHNGGPG